MTKKAARQQKIDWNTAIAEGRVMRSQGGLSFQSFATRSEALQAIQRIQVAGMTAEIVDPALADDAYLAKAHCSFGECGQKRCNGCGVEL